ncbi:MAG: twitching motility protein PilT [Lachnospiraceae bacterium]|nr:twitching motility protein PilT [Lachnospiraceae bacterium]
MVSFIVGEKGKGKTKILLDRVNAEVKNASGNVVYLDKSTKHMFELNNRIRLISVPDYDISNGDEFLGFLTGIISQDHDLEQMYLDSFLKIAHLEGKDITGAVKRLQAISEKFDVDFFLSLSMNAKDLPEEFAENVIAAL